MKDLSRGSALSTSLPDWVICFILIFPENFEGRNPIIKHTQLSLRLMYVLTLLTPIPTNNCNYGMMFFIVLSSWRLVFQVKKYFFPDYILSLAAEKIMVSGGWALGAPWVSFSIIQTCKHNHMCMYVRVCVCVGVCMCMCVYMWVCVENDHPQHFSFLSGTAWYSLYKLFR